MPRESGTEVTAQEDRQRRLAASFRAVASTAAEQAGGGVALVFACESDDTPRLRAAAGFGEPEMARATARKLIPDVREALQSGTGRRCDPIEVLGKRASGGLMIFPLIFEATIHGALAVGSPVPLTPESERAMVQIADLLALRLDHIQISEEVNRLRQQQSSSDPGDEVLRLSEELFAQDIELLRSHEKIGKIEKLKNDFIEKMSRELRTPLNSIIESIISVLTGENEALSDAAKASLRAALDDGTAFLRTLQNILDLWRIKQGELPVEIQDVNFRETVDESIFSIQDSLADKPLRVEPHLVQPFPKIRTDLTKINQILFLLLDNAAKFTQRGKISITAHLTDDQLVCEVRDTGIGICQDDQQFIFDEFYQVDESSSHTYSGAGLGLTLVRDLVALLDGEISVSSEVGTGTSVTFRIPMQLA